MRAIKASGYLLTQKKIVGRGERSTPALRQLFGLTKHRKVAINVSSELKVEISFLRSARVCALNFLRTSPAAHTHTRLLRD